MEWPWLRLGPLFQSVKFAEERPILCPQCQSSDGRELRTEIMIHNGHLDGTMPVLFAFPKAWVCFGCGCSTFTPAKNELLELREACMLAIQARLADKLHLSSPHIVHRSGNFDASLLFQFLQDWT